MLQALVELSEEFVEQMSAGGAVVVAVLSPAPVVLAGRGAVGGDSEGHSQPTAAKRLFLMWRWVIASALLSGGRDFARRRRNQLTSQLTGSGVDSEPGEALT
jgi:hypothetical protein